MERWKTIGADAGFTPVLLHSHREKHSSAQAFQHGRIPAGLLRQWAAAVHSLHAASRHMLPAGTGVPSDPATSLQAPLQDHTLCISGGFRCNFVEEQSVVEVYRVIDPWLRI